jgi:hypothetical protein
MADLLELAVKIDWEDLRPLHIIGPLELSLCQSTALISTLILSYGLGIWPIFRIGYTIYDACTLSTIQH